MEIQAIVMFWWYWGCQGEVGLIKLAVSGLKIKTLDHASKVSVLGFYLLAESNQCRTFLGVPAFRFRFLGNCLGFGTFPGIRSLVLFALISKDFCFLVLVAVSYGRNKRNCVTFQASSNACPFTSITWSFKFKIGKCLLSLRGVFEAGLTASRN